MSMGERWNIENRKKQLSVSEIGLISEPVRERDGGIGKSKRKREVEKDRQTYR